jgi:hypothetical protein
MTTASSAGDTAAAFPAALYILLKTAAKQRLIGHRLQPLTSRISRGIPALLIELYNKADNLYIRRQRL